MSQVARTGVIAFLISAAIHGLVIGTILLLSPSQSRQASAVPSVKRVSANEPKARQPLDPGLSVITLAAGAIVLLFAGIVFVASIARRDRIPHGLTAEESSEPQSLPGGGFHKQRLAILIAAGLGMVATFLPWVHAPIIGAVAGTRGDGWITLVLFAPAMIAALIGSTSLPLTGAQRLAVVLPAGIAGLIGVWKIIDFNIRMAQLQDDSPFAAALSLSVDIGIGLYLLVVAGGTVPIVAWVLANRRASQVAQPEKGTS